MMRARWCLLSLVVIAAAAPRGHAQPASVQAQSLFDDGQRLMQAGKLAEACAAFESSQKLDPAVITLLNLADCRERNHQLATAWGTFADANRMARATSNDKLARVATTHARRLEPRLSKLTISVPADHNVPGLEVLRGNDRVDPAGWNHALPIDGGTYTIAARAPGRTPWSITRTIKIESDAQTIEIPKLAEARPGTVATTRPGSAAAPPAGVAPTGSAGAASTANPNAGTPGVASTAKPSAGSPAGAPGANYPGVAPSARPAAGNAGTGSSKVIADAGSAAPAAGSPASGAAPSPVRTDAGAHSTAAVDGSAAPEPTPPVDQPEPGHAAGRYVWPIAFGVGALAAGGVALGFNIAGDHKYDDAKSANLRGSVTEADSLYQQANTRRYAAEGFAVAAIGCAGAAIYLYIRSRGEGGAETTAITPVASPQLTGLAVAGSW
jgi:hypothetical protein